MNKLITTIQYLDLFGVPIGLLTHNKQKSHTSFFGGVISFFLASISLGYFIYVMQLWINNEIPPNVSSKQQTNGYAEFSWNEALIQFSLEDFIYDTNPFSAQNNIITPLLFQITGSLMSEQPITLFDDINDKERSVLLKNGSLILNNQYDTDQDHKEMKQYLLVFATCQEQFMTKDSYCASNETIEKYMSQYHGLLFLTIRLNQLNYMNRNLDFFSKQYYTAFVPNQYTYSQVMLKQQQTIIDDGILFKNYQDYNFLNNYELINQQVDQNFMSNIIKHMSNGKYSINCFSSYLFRIDNISIVEEIVMPKLGQILAQIGSIVQLVFLLKYLVLYYNKSKLESDLYHDIITMYYPEIKSYTYQNNIFQKIIFQDQNTVLKDKYKSLLRQAKEKCRFINILYEISRIQFILEAQFGVTLLNQSHQLGGKIIKNETDEHVDIKESNRLVVKPIDSFDFKQSCNSIEPLEILIKQK